MKAGIPRVGSLVGGPILFGRVSHWGFLREMQQCWRRSALEKINLDEICSNGYVFQVEMCYIAEKLKLRMLEVPIYFPDRRVGTSKMTPLVKIEAALRVFEIRWRNRDLGSRSVLVESREQQKRLQREELGLSPNR